MTLVRVLAIDTALDKVQAAVFAAGVPLSHAARPAAGDAEAIGEQVDGAVRDAGLSLEDLDRIAVTVGPGSFTGVRVGVAYAKGLSFALKIPAVGVSTLAALTAPDADNALAVVDARHGSVYAGFYGRNGAAEVEAKLSIQDALALSRARAATIVGPQSAVDALGEGTVVAGVDMAALVARAAGDPTGRAPRALYLSAVDAAPQRHKALARA